MSSIKITDEFARHIDNMEDADALESYTPSKAKKVVNDQLFNSDEYNDSAAKFSMTADDIAEDKRKKIVKGAIILVIIAVAVIVTILIIKNITGKFEQNIRQTEAIQNFINNGTLIEKSKLPIDKIIDNANEVDTDLDGIINKVEIELGSLTNCIDSDKDGIPDKKEIDIHGLNVTGNSNEQRLADIKSMQYDAHHTLIANKIDNNEVSKALGIDEKYIIAAYKVYNAIGEITFKNIHGAKSLLRFNSLYNGFNVLKYKESTDGLKVQLDGDCVVIAFNTSKKNVFKQISYKQINNNQLASEYVNSKNGLPMYNKLYANVNFKTKFDLKTNVIPFNTVWDSVNGPNSLGQAMFIGAMYNGAVVSTYEDLADGYKDFKWIAQSDYHYNLSEYIGTKLNEIEFKSQQLKISTTESRKPIVSDRLPRPDKEYVGLINQLNNIILDKSIEDIAIKSGSSKESTLNKVIDEVHRGNTILAVMSNNDSIHAILLYGVCRSEIDNDVYNFSVYDSNINNTIDNTLNIMQVRVRKYADSVESGGTYVEYEYGYGQSYKWQSSKSDVFLFYRLRTDLEIEKIQ